MFVITSGYAAFSTNITLHAKGNIIEGPRVIQAWDENSQTDFHSDYYKQNIVSATFVDNNNVPDSAAESWNVSEDKENGEVMAWVVPTASDNSKYDLYIGAKAGVIANENSGYVFYNFRSLKEINFDNNFDTSNVEDMTQMFRCCASLESIDLSTLDTSNVTNMNDLFNMWDSSAGIWISNKLSKITFGSNFDTSNVTTMRNMFVGLAELKKIDVSNFNTSNVTDMYHMFWSCQNLTELDVSNFDTSKVTDMEGMFCMWISGENNVSNLTELDVSLFDTRNVTSMRDMFAYNTNLVEIKGLETFDTSRVTNMYHMFTHCEKLKALNLCSFDTRNVNNMKAMMSETFNLKKLYVGPNWSTAQADASWLINNSGVSSVTTGQC